MHQKMPNHGHHSPRRWKKAILATNLESRSWQTSQRGIIVLNAHIAAAFRQSDDNKHGSKCLDQQQSGYV